MMGSNADGHTNTITRELSYQHALHARARARGGGYVICEPMPIEVVAGIGIAHRPPAIPQRKGNQGVGHVPPLLPAQHRQGCCIM